MFRDLPRLRAVWASLAIAVLSGCVYRIDVQQGNLLEESAIEQVQVGMTRSQVQFLLGTPMVSDAFHRDRWDYPYYFRPGRSRQVAQRWIVVYFDDDRVARVEHRREVAGPRPDIDVDVDPERERDLDARDMDPAGS